MLNYFLFHFADSSFEGVFPMTGLKGSCSNKNTFKAESMHSISIYWKYIDRLYGI